MTGGLGGTYSETDTYDPVTGTLSSKAGVTYGYRDPAHRQAVTHRGSTLSYTYDANGNQTWRRVWGTSASLTYDEENHLTAVSGGASASYVYDGDGQLVKATVGDTTTVYIGDYYEYELGSGTTRKYYYAGGQRVAMRENGILSWLLSDHLGSTTIAANLAGTERGERRYQAWGWARYAWGSTPTSYRYTGQRQEAALGLYSYGARWYDPALGRFIQPDPIVPEPGKPLAYDRYAYAYNNPVKFIDPSGHYVVCGTQASGGECNGGTYYAGFSVLDRRPEVQAYLRETMDPKHFLDPIATWLSTGMLGAVVAGEFAPIAGVASPQVQTERGASAFKTADAIGDPGPGPQAGLHNGLTRAQVHTIGVEAGRAKALADGLEPTCRVPIDRFASRAH